MLKRNDDSHVVSLSPEELAEHRHGLAGVDVYVEGRGEVRGQDLSGLSCRLLMFRGTSWMDEWVGARPRIRFFDCDFSGLTVQHLMFAGASFHRCTFADIKAVLHFGTDEVEFVECRFSGDLAGNISPGDSRLRKLKVVGNDFSRLRGVGFHDGVEWRSNTFDLGRTQLILEREDAADPRVREVFESTDMAQLLTDSLIHRRPINYGQSWTLLGRDEFRPDTWARLVVLLGHHASE